MPLKRFSKGPIETVVMLNELVDALNNLLNINGDVFIRVNNTPVGTTLRLNVDEIIRRVPKYGTGGGGGTQIRKAFVKTTPGASTSVVCFLDVDTTGTEVTVSVKIYAGGGNLNTAEPALVDGDDFLVYNDNGTWRNVTTFFRVDSCP